MLLDLSSRIATTLFPMLAIVLAGLFYARKFKPDFSVPNTVNMDVFVPALVFSVLVGGDFRVVEMGQLALGAAALTLLCGPLVWLLARTFGWPGKAFVPPIMFRNSGNIGLPMAVFAFGEDALPAATLVFLVENTLHFSVGTRLLSPGASLMQVLKIPVVWVSVLALALNVADTAPPPVVLMPIKMLGEVCIPLMLFGLGVRLYNADLREWRIGLAAGIAAPILGLVCFVLVQPWLDLPPLQLAALLIYAVLPPAVLNFMFAERFKQYPAKVASIIAMSHIVSLVSLPLVLAWALSKIVVP
ncbi:MAG: AEC family transporter [Granulosicoccaceae bacterium]